MAEILVYISSHCFLNFPDKYHNVLFCPRGSGKSLKEYFLKFPCRQFQGESSQETEEETDPELAHEPLRDEPHAVGDGVGLQQEEVEVEGQVEEVGHEGDLGDGQPEAPGEEGVDDPPVAPAASEGDPHQTEAPGSLAVCVIELYLVPTLPMEIWPVDQHQSQCDGG